MYSDSINGGSKGEFRTWAAKMWAFRMYNLCTVRSTRTTSLHFSAFKPHKYPYGYSF